MKLSSITIEGTMQGPIYWLAGDICETTFRQYFTPPKAPKSPWNERWQGLDAALQTVLASGDFQGGMGDLVEGTITFQLLTKRGSMTVTRHLGDMAAAQPYLAKDS